MMNGGRPAVFLDRDGTIIHDRHYLGDPGGVELLPDAAAAIGRLNRAEMPVILVTNQSGIGRGYFSSADFRATQRRLAELLAGQGAWLDAEYHCPHSPDHGPPCDCRKPAPGLFERAAREHGIDLGRSWFVGDRLRDVAPARHWGGGMFLIHPRGGPHEDAPESVHVVPNLIMAVDSVLGSAPSD